MDDRYAMSAPLRTALAEYIRAAATMGHALSETIDTLTVAHVTCERCGETLSVGYAVDNPRADPVILAGQHLLNTPCPGPTDR
jgi:uracil phosphoribosyltransferase